MELGAASNLVSLEEASALRVFPLPNAETSRRAVQATSEPSQPQLWKEADGYKYLKEHIFPQIAPPPYGHITREKLSERKPVYLFREDTQNIMVVGKVWKYGLLSVEEAWTLAEREYFNLLLARKRLGMDGGRHRVVAPLGKSKELSALLVTERAPGGTLDHYIARAIYEGRAERLFSKLSDLAGFLAKLHGNSQTNKQVSLEVPAWYLCTLLDCLSGQILSPLERDNLNETAARWWHEHSIFEEDGQVMVHGDATPCNFLFQDQGVIAIDLEKMHWADRCWDLGFVVAELKHHFMWRMGDGWAAEPFIGHFLWEYAVSYGDTQFFHVITRKVPLYMALGLLRIARNPWLDGPHRRNLLKEAEGCLRYGL